MTELLVSQSDITTLDVDAIVNAANSALIPGGGVDGAIHRAGGPEIAEEAKPHAPLATAEVIVTTAGNLPARAVIHTVGPIWSEHEYTAAVKLLGWCYLSSLDLAVSRGFESIAFPNISTGVYGFPKEQAAKTAIGTVKKWVGSGGTEMESVHFVCFDDENFRLYESLLSDSS